MRRFAWMTLTRVASSVAALTTVLIAVGASPGERSGGVPLDDSRSRRAEWVVVGADGQATARVITTDRECPFIQLDQVPYQMSLRAGPETIPQRPTTSGPQDSKASAFPVTTCEYPIPDSTRIARVISGHEEAGDLADQTSESARDEARSGGSEEPEAWAVEHDQRLSVRRAGAGVLPLPKRNPRRIVILGDTGCRLKIGDPWQACSDPEEWPLQTIAETAASFHPDLVLHVGDYHYRENQCPADIGGCQGSPWGYGWDAWEADLFKPAARLLAAAPWIMVRGNHEECARAGQGWYRFLDTQPYVPTRSCNDPAFDATANYNDPYAVPIGKNAQIIVFDSSKVTKSKLTPADAAFATYQAQLEKVAALVQPGMLNIWTNHHPLLAFSPVAGTAVTGGNPALLSVMYATYGTDYYPPGIALALHGHTHILEILNFASNHPATLMAGNGGDNLDFNLPDPLPPDAHPDGDFASVVDVAQIAHTSTFGFVVADRRAGERWSFRAYTRDGRLLTTCAFAESKMSCSKLGFLH